MNAQTRRYLHLVLLVLGLVLMIGGIVARKYGAAGIGLILAAVNARQLRKPKIQ
ncbi:MAG: hypothetical protein H6Q78_1730 [Candidatus Krumholzibacteriota bacterium]|nr:hypothetical protein [Candidatus Krumholzibacteriota bacterium]